MDGGLRVCPARFVRWDDALTHLIDTHRHAERLGEVGQEGLGVGVGQAAADLDRLLDGGERLLMMPQPAPGGSRTRANRAEKGAPPGSATCPATRWQEHGGSRIRTCVGRANGFTARLL